MDEQSGSNFNWFLLLAAAMAAGLAVAAWFVAGGYPLSADADAQGRIEEFVSWQGDGPTPAQSRGPLHFYLLKLFAPAANPTNPQAALADILCGAGFLFFYLLFSKRLFGEWIAIGSGLAVCFHPAFLKSVIAPTGFPLFYFLIFAGFWALAPAFAEDPAPRIWRAIFGGLALSLAVFVRFEGGFFLLCCIVLLLAYRRHRQWIAVTVAGLITAIILSMATYSDPLSYLRGGTLFVGYQPLAERISVLEFGGYLLSTFGVFPLAAGFIGALLALKDRMLRPWAILFLLYGCLVLWTFVRTRFQHDLDRYYLYLLLGFLPFFGFFIKSVLPREKSKQAGLVALAAYLICVFFYGGFSVDALREASKIKSETSIEVFK